MTASTPSLVQNLPTPPDAAQKSHIVTAPHGAQRSDEYYWLRDDSRTDPQVLAYLQAENAFADEVMAPLKPVEDALFDEIVGRIKQDDASVPYRERGWWYYSRFETGQDYPVYARRMDADDVDAASIQQANAAGDFAAEQVLLDVNAMAEGHDYFDVGDSAVSQDNRLLAWAQDDVGRRQYVIHVKDLDSGEVFTDRIEGTSGDIVWADDNRTVFYVENDPGTLLTKRVKNHLLGSPTSDDVVVYEEADDSFYMGIDRSRDDRYICIGIDSTVSSELRHAPAADPDQGFAILAARERDVEYTADHHRGRWVIRTNAPGVDGAPAKNFKLVTAASDATARGDWQEWIAHDPDVYIEDFELFDGFTAVAERSNGLERIRLVRHALKSPATDGRVLAQDAQGDYVTTDEPAYSMGLDINSEPDTDWLRYGYTSLTTPETTYELNTRTSERRVLKRQPVPNYDPTLYVTQRVWARARDGARVPVSLVYKKGFEKDGTAALLQYGYGSYGLSMDPHFNQPVISLLDRGMVYAIAHIRGGQEMGRAWYDAGKLLDKRNSFNDFIDVTRHLVDEGFAAPDRVAAFGGSAGGLLMGAIGNMAPDSYDVILSQVPFVDVVTTMLDMSIPLTTNEYDEWGNPETSVESYECMLSYSPYDNLQAQAYPAMFIGTGLWDSQVQYWEPAKYVARLRDLNTSGEPVVLRINMDAGHGGKSGRFRRYRELAEMYAFMLDRLKISGAM